MARRSSQNSTNMTRLLLLGLFVTALCGVGYGSIQSGRMEWLPLSNQPQSQEVFGAIKAGDLQRVLELVREPSVVDARMQDEHVRLKGIAPLHYAVIKHDIEIVQALLNADADVNWTSPPYSISPLMEVAEQRLAEGDPDNRVSIMKMLLGAGADIEAKDFKGRTPLMRAAGNKIEDLVQILLDGGARIDNGKEPSWRAVHAACWSESSENLELLIRSGAALDTKHGATSLVMVAVKYGTASHLRLLIDNGVPVDLADQNTSEQPIHMVARDWIFKEKAALMMKMLLDAGADPNARDRRGETPLMTALRLAAFPKVVEMLLNAGADPMLEDNDHKNAFHKIMRNPMNRDHKPAMQMLLAHTPAEQLEKLDLTSLSRLIFRDAEKQVLFQMIEDKINQLKIDSL